TETGRDVYQPFEQAPPLHWMLVLGAVPSAVTVNEVAPEVRPALFVAVTLFGSVGSAALEAKLYVAVPPDSVRDQPKPRFGKLYEATPDSLSVEVGVRSNEPAPPERK